jgi:hypothetical protein
MKTAAMTPRITAATMVAAAVLVNLAFTGLGIAFDYPEILKHPPAEALAAFRASQGVVPAWFLLLALGAALLAPVAIGVGRMSTHRAMRLAVPVGVAAALVQVVGLLRWPLLVPGWAADDDVAAFTTANRVLGNLIGETFGYLLTAAWTGLVLVALGAAFAGRRFVVLGGVAAVLILLGVLSPLELPVVDLANLVGYVLWSAWLLIFAVVLGGRGARQPSQAAPGV